VFLFQLWERRWSGFWQKSDILRRFSSFCVAVPSETDCSYNWSRKRKNERKKERKGSFGSFILCRDDGSIRGQLMLQLVKRKKERKKEGRKAKKKERKGSFGSFIHSEKMGKKRLFCSPPKNWVAMDD
jgi:hypothetical protein